MSRFKKNSIIIIVCALVGLYSFLPSVFPAIFMGEKFDRIWPELNGDRLYYFARINEVNEGYQGINHPYFFEHKNDVYPQATGGEKAMAFISRITKGDIADVHVAFDFFSPFLVAFLFYVFLKTLGVRGRYALPATLLLFTIVSEPILKPIHPLVSFPLFLGFLICWLKLNFTARKKLFAVFAGILLGSLFLVYFYHWSFILVILGIHALLLLARKEYSLFRHHLLIVGIGTFIGIPYLFLIMQGMHAPFHEETMVRVGVYFSHWPETIPRLLVALVWLAFFLWWGKVSKLLHKPEFSAIATLLVANVIYPNHQIISGVIIQNANHWSFMPVILYFVAGSYILTETFTLRSYDSLRRPFPKWAVVGVVSLLVTIPVMRLSDINVATYFRSLKSTEKEEKKQDYRPLFDWIHTIPKDSVIFANTELSRFIPAYTYANVYYSEYAFNLPGSDKEVIERALLSQFFNQTFFSNGRFDIKVDSRILWIQPGQSERNTHLIHRVFNIPYEEKYSLEKEIKKVNDVYLDLKRQGWTVSLLKKYKVDFIVWDKESDPQWNLSVYPELKHVRTINRFEIYVFPSKL